jgi:predicted DNA-binding ribbon-helix-helix protein
MPPLKARIGKSLVLKRNIRIDGHKTSVSLESAFWDELKSIADAQGIPANQLVATIDKERRERQCFNLSSAIRLFVLDHYRQRDVRGAVP